MKRIVILLAIMLAISYAFTTTRNEVTIGAGDQLASIPVDMYWKNSLYQCLYMQNELGIVSGTIQSITFYNSFTSNLPNKPTRIWLGTTPNTSLAGGWIPSTQLQLVWDGNVSYPSGQNQIQIAFQTPYSYPGGNLVMMVQRPMDANYYAETDLFFAQAGEIGRSLKAQSDNTTYNPAIPPTSFSISDMFPKTTFTYDGSLIEHDLAALSITGSNIPTMDSSSDYVIVVRNNGLLPQADYTIKLMKTGGIELESVAGTLIAPNQEVSFTIPWSPAQIETSMLYGQVFLDGDQVPANDASPGINIAVQAPGTVGITVGTGIENARIPVDMNWSRSLFQTVYLASEIGATGLITGLMFYNTFEEDLPAKRTMIWLAETTRTNLADAWVPSTEMNLVYDGWVDYPAGQNEILITLQQPFAFNEGNLLMMVHRPVDSNFYSMFNTFKSQTVGSNRSRNSFTHTSPIDPANPPNIVTVSGQFPKTTFMIVSAGSGTLQGTVYGLNNAPLEGALIQAGNTSTTSEPNGFFSLSLPEGVYSVSASASGHHDQLLQNINITSGEITTLDIQLLPVTAFFQDGFEDYPDFTLQFSPWTLIDIDQAPTFGISGVTWPNRNSPMAFIIFNPSSTTPQIHDAPPHSGTKYAASFASSASMNDDWLISPPIIGGGELKFYARSYMDTYGLERFQVLISDSGTDPEDFTIISGTGYLEAPDAWTEYVYSLASYQDQQIHVAIRCISSEAFLFMLDDFAVSGANDAFEEVIPVQESALLGNYPNPFNPHTNIRFRIGATNTEFDLSIFNSRGQKVKTLHKGMLDPGTHLLNWNGTDQQGLPVSSGVYFYKLSAPGFLESRKMLLLK